MFLDCEGLFGVGEEEFGGFGGGFVEENACGGGGDFGIGGEGFAVDDHELGAAVGGWEMEHADALDVFRDSEMVFGKEAGDRGVVRSAAESSSETRVWF